KRISDYAAKEICWARGKVACPVFRLRARKCTENISAWPAMTQRSFFHVTQHSRRPVAKRCASCFICSARTKRLRWSVPDNLVDCVSCAARARRFCSGGQLDELFLRLDVRLDPAR